MFAQQIRQAVEAAPREGLPEINRLLWSAFAAGSVTEAEAEALSAMIDARGKVIQVVPAPVPRARGGSRPRSDASMERRRRWAAAGRLPPQLAAQFTLAETAVLAVVTVEVGKRGDCRLHIEAIAALAGVSRSTVKAAIRRARLLGLLTLQERRANAWRNLSNVVRIISREWIGWMRLTRADRVLGGGVKFATATSTRSSNQSRQRSSEGRIPLSAQTTMKDSIARERAMH